MKRNIRAIGREVMLHRQMDTLNFKHMKNTRDILIKTLTGGCTVKLKDDAYYEPTNGFAISVAGCEKQYLVQDLCESDIIRYIIEFKSHLLEAGFYLGTWLNHDTVYLDCTMIYHGTRESAIMIGQAAGQKAIYNLDTKETVSCE